MSSVTELQQQLLGNYINTSSKVLFLYETLLTLSQEGAAIWSRKWTMMTWLYALTRYGTAINQLNLLLPVQNEVRYLPASGYTLAHWKPNFDHYFSCKTDVYMDYALTLLQYLCIACFSALRVYALLNGRYLVACLVFLLNLVPFAINMFGDIDSVLFEDSETCTAFRLGWSNELELSSSLTTRLAVIIGDILILVVTWLKTAHAYLEARRMNIKAPLMTMLVRDGTIYFIVLLILNILQMINNDVRNLYLLGYIQPFFNVMPPIIMCRFILNLRQIKPAGNSWIDNQSHSLRFVGNLGESLQFGGNEDGEGGEDDDDIEFETVPAGADVSFSTTRATGPIEVRDG